MIILDILGCLFNIRLFVDHKIVLKIYDIVWLDKNGIILDSERSALDDQF